MNYDAQMYYEGLGASVPNPSSSSEVQRPVRTSVDSRMIQKVADFLGVDDLVSNRGSRP